MRPLGVGIHFLKQDWVNNDSTFDKHLDSLPPFTSESVPFIVLMMNDSKFNESLTIADKSLSLIIWTIMVVKRENVEAADEFRSGELVDFKSRSGFSQLGPVEIEAAFNMEILHTQFHQFLLTKAILNTPRPVRSKTFVIHSSVGLEESPQQIEGDLAIS